MRRAPQQERFFVRSKEKARTFLPGPFGFQFLVSFY